MSLRKWDEMSLLEQYACIYSDRFKDAYGFRPRGNETADWNEIQYLAEFARLNEIVDRQAEEDKDEIFVDINGTGGKW